jgi:DNA-binding MarR family transcriptional regulator
MMEGHVTPEQLLATARDLDGDEFTRPELADRLGVRAQDLTDAVRSARQSGGLEKVRDDDKGRGVFRLVGE